MQRVERKATLAAPIDQVFAFVSALENLPQWQSGILSSRLTSDGPMGPGSTAEVLREVMGQRITAVVTVNEYDPPRHLGISSSIGGVTAVGAIELSSVPVGTQISFVVELRGSGLTAFMEPLIASAVADEVGLSLRQLQERFAAHDR